MSGIVGILNLDGRPVDRDLLLRMCASLSYRGPDAQEIWSDGPIGFGHAMLQTAGESPGDRQPSSLDGHVWITADARVDGRSDLIRELQGKGRDAARSATDAELILHAYHAWGELCVQHLLGDFAFAIWDGLSRRLICVRDHFGVKPFYYAPDRGCLVFSNTLNCLGLHPAVSGELNDLAIGDFLLFDFNQDPATTTFADIQRLPPAHILEWSDGTLRIRRYWTLPVEPPLECKRPSECIEQFRELLDAAVADRLRCDRVGIFMSGGLDSASVAASLCGVVSKRGTPCDVRAFTQVFDKLIPHAERHYSRLVADTLRIPIHYQVIDGILLYQGYNHGEPPTPEPSHYPLAASDTNQLREASGYGRVALTGYGGDPGFSSLISSYVRKHLKSRQFRQVVADLARYARSEGRLSRLYIRTRLRRWFGRNLQGSFPTWLNEDFRNRFDLQGRWEQAHNSPKPVRPVRPEAYDAITANLWPYLFEWYDTAATSLPLEVYHPFFDLRLLRFLLRLPALPWCSDKELIRAAMRGILPDSVRLRPKSPLPAEPLVKLLQRPEANWVDKFESAEGLSRYIVRSRVPAVAGEKDSWRAWINLRPLSLNFWLHGHR